MKKEQAIELRRKAKFYSNKGIKKTKIAQNLGISRPTLNRWLKIKDEDIEKDDRGWEKGKKRKYTDKQEEAVIEKRRELEDKFFLEQKQLNRN